MKLTMGCQWARYLVSVSCVVCRMSDVGCLSCFLCPVSSILSECRQAESSLLSQVMHGQD
jgi:hypothetical protein